MTDDRGHTGTAAQRASASQGAGKSQCPGKKLQQKNEKYVPI